MLQGHNGTSIATTGPLIIKHPKSRLIPVGSEANFTCKFLNADVNAHRPYWRVNDYHAHINETKNDLRRQGFFISPDMISDGITTLSLRVNASYSGVNNTVIRCTTRDNDITSDEATLIKIAGIVTKISSFHFVHV